MKRILLVVGLPELGGVMTMFNNWSILYSIHQRQQVKAAGQQERACQRCSLPGVVARAGIMRGGLQHCHMGSSSSSRSAAAVPCSVCQQQMVVLY